MLQIRLCKTNGSKNNNNNIYAKQRVKSFKNLHILKQRKKKGYHNNNNDNTTKLKRNVKEHDFVKSQIFITYRGFFCTVP